MLKPQDLQMQLNNALLETAETLYNSKLINHIDNYKIWMFFDKNHNLYWAVSNKIENSALFNINVFKAKNNHLEFNFDNVIAESTCSLKTICDGNQVWFIDSLWVKNKHDQGKGIGTQMLQIIKLVTNSESTASLTGCMKAFTDDKTPKELRNFYMNQGFAVIAHDKVKSAYNCNKPVETATIKRNIAKSELDTLSNNLVAVNECGIPFHILCPEGYKPVIETIFANELSK